MSCKWNVPLSTFECGHYEQICIWSGKQRKSTIYKEDKCFWIHELLDCRLQMYFSEEWDKPTYSRHPDLFINHQSLTAHKNYDGSGVFLYIHSYWLTHMDILILIPRTHMNNVPAYRLFVRQGIRWQPSISWAGWSIQRGISVTTLHYHSGLWSPI